MKDIFEDTIKDIEEDVIKLKQDTERWEKIRDDPERAKLYLKYYIPVIYTNLQMLFTYEKANLKLMKILTNNLDKLPKTEQIDKTKEELEKQIQDTLIPLQKIIEGEQEIRNRQNDIYG